jgi:hypothetical protein
MFCDKYLKNWYLLPTLRSATRTPPASLEGEFAHAGLLHFMQPSHTRNMQGKMAGHDDGFLNQRGIA